MVREDLFTTIQRWIKAYRRSRRRRRAATLPMIEARIVHCTTQVAEAETLSFEVVLSYRFEVAGEGAYGSAFSEQIASQNQANVLLAEVSPEALLKVRYNPNDAFENYALAGDNAGVLPFGLAE